MTFLIYFITYLCIIATFFNDGFTQMYFSIPFILFLLVDSIYSKGLRSFILNAIAIVVLFLLAITRFSNPIIYPILNQERVMQKDYNLTHFPYHTPSLVESKYLKMYFPYAEQYEYYKKMNLYQEYHLKKGTRITPVKVEISGHPDIVGISYSVQIDMNDSQLKNEIQKYILSHNKNLAPEISSRLPKNVEKGYLQLYKVSTLNTSDDIYAGEWFYYQKPYSIIEKYLGWIIIMFNPMFIWGYLIILGFQIYYLMHKYRKM